MPHCWPGDQLSIAYDANEHISHFGWLNGGINLRIRSRDYDVQSAFIFGGVEDVKWPFLIAP